MGYRVEYETVRPDPFPGAYRAANAKHWSRGVAWHIVGYEVQADENTEWTGILERTGRIVAVMVGDDTRHVFDADDLVPLRRSEYCGGCGQIGCGRDPGGEDD